MSSVRASHDRAGRVAAARSQLAGLLAQRDAARAFAIRNPADAQEYRDPARIPGGLILDLRI